MTIHYELANEAAYILVNGRIEGIKDTFFTSGNCHNSDVFNIVTKSGCYEFFDDSVDWDDLRTRYNKK